MKDKLNWLLVLVALLSIGMLSCGSIMDSITPTNISERSASYVDEPNQAGLQSLSEAKEMRADIIVTHRDVNVKLKRLAQDDKYYYTIALGFIDGSIEEAEALQDLVVGDEAHPFSILGMLGPLAGGAFVGKELFKRKKDYSPEVYDADVEAAFDSGMKAAKLVVINEDETEKS